MAGIGNVFLTDDGWGPSVVSRLAGREPLDGARVVDYGIRGLHLAYDLLDHDGPVVIVDTVPGPGSPGDVVVLEVSDVPEGRPLDAHGMDPASVLANLERLGGTPPPTYVVGCVPEDVDEGLGLTPTTGAAVERGVEAVRRLVADLQVGAVG